MWTKLCTSDPIQMTFQCCNNFRCLQHKICVLIKILKSNFQNFIFPVEKNPLTLERSIRTSLLLQAATKESSGLNAQCCMYPSVVPIITPLICSPACREINNTCIFTYHFQTVSFICSLIFWWIMPSIFDELLPDC